MRATHDDHEILGLARSAGVEEIRAAYRRAAKTAHPDQGGSAEAFMRVQRAAERLLADLQTRGFFDGASTYRAGDRTSVGGDWMQVSDTLRSRWGLSSEPAVVFAPHKIGLTPFVTETALNVPAYNWLLRMAGPRGEAWDFHIAGSQARIFFRRPEDARLFKQRFA
jgi:hypothetical protein